MVGVQSPSKIKPPADCRGAQKKNVMQSMTRTSQQVRQGVLEFIESYCEDVTASVYIFIRKRKESDNYVIVSFFRKKAVFQGISTFWQLKEKITDTATIEMYRNPSYHK